MGSRKLSSLVKSLFVTSLDWLFPPRCAGCARLGEVWCQSCHSQVELIREPYCDLCGSPKMPKVQCLHCSNWDYKFDAARAWGRYSGVLRKAILSLKRHPNTQLGIELSKGLTAVLLRQAWKIDILVPVPLAPHRLAERGYNQADLLAQPLAAACGLRYAGSCLSRSHETIKQFELGAAQRWQNLLSAFQAEGAELHEASVLLVDDIMTTGATLNAAAVAIKRAGARRVYALTLAKTFLEEEQGVW